MYTRPYVFTCRCTFNHLSIALCLLMAVAPSAPIKAQDTVTGAFWGQVTDSKNNPIPDAMVRFINQVSKIPYSRRTGTDGRFYQGQLQPGMYTIEVSAGTTFKSIAFERMLIATMQNKVVPLPI